jgi:hypothetical protein
MIIGGTLSCALGILAALPPKLKRPVLFSVLTLLNTHLLLTIGCVCAGLAVWLHVSPYLADSKLR